MPLNPVKSEELFFELKLSYHSHLEKSKKAQGFKEGIPGKRRAKTSSSTFSGKNSSACLPRLQNCITLFPKFSRKHWEFIKPPGGLRESSSGLTDSFQPPL